MKLRNILIGLSVVWLAVGSDIHAEIGESCQLEADCHDGLSGNLSTCHFNNTCICLDTAVYEPGESPLKCRPKATKLGDPCERNSQCTQGVGSGRLTGTICTGGFCVCDDEHVASRDDLTCLKKVDKLHEKCGQYDQCTVENSECRPATNGTCQCLPVWFIEGIVNPNTCNPVRIAVNQQCLEDNQCSAITADIDPLKQAGCTDKRCQCPDGRQHFNNYCTKSVALGLRCEHNDECRLGTNDHAVCIGIPGGNPLDTICTCDSESEPNGGLCIPKRSDGTVVVSNLIFIISLVVLSLIK